MFGFLSLAQVSSKICSTVNNAVVILFVDSWDFIL